MSGPFINKSSRRDFLRYTGTIGLGALLLPRLSACRTDPYAHITGEILGANSKVGHRLRTGNFPPPGNTIYTNTAIIGAGVSGLSAARHLHQHGHRDFIILELGDTAGGNAVGGTNSFTAYPWGAHYLPIPNNNLTELMHFLEECGSITGYQNGLPVYNEYHLCMDPEERLFIRGHWQEGIIPQAGVPAKELADIKRFLDLVHTLRETKGSDERYAFDMPVDMSSSDATWRSLDQVSFAQYLRQEGYHSEHLFWYLDYCCRDDYGTTLEHTSAWAGLHYFAGRRGKAANASQGALLTWPEGNSFLIQNLQKDIPDTSIRTRQLVYHIDQIADSKLQLQVWDSQYDRSYTIECRQVIMATPFMVNQRLLPENLCPAYSTFSSAPWLVANIALSAQPAPGEGIPLCWDNVIYGSNSLGYVNATHQQVNRHQGAQVYTFYKPLSHLPPVESRKEAYNKTHRQWVAEIMDELKSVHRDMPKLTRKIDIWLWGHGMIRPVPGFIWGQERRQSMKNKGSVYFAHTDQSGISIFEEGFYQGLRAAQAILNNT